MPSKTGVVVKLLGQDGNIFNLYGICARELRCAGFAEEATELRTKVMNAGSYDEALRLFMEYCDVE